MAPPPSPVDLACLRLHQKIKEMAAKRATPPITPTPIPTFIGVLSDDDFAALLWVADAADSLVVLGVEV